MDRAHWTYEIPTAAADASGLEDYEVESVDGKALGKVKVVLQRGDERFLAVEGGLPPARSELLAVPWDAVADVDEALTVRLAADALERAVALEPGMAVEGGAAEASRVTTLGREPAAAPPRAERGPVDRASYLVALLFGVVGIFGTLALIALGTAADLGWLWALAAIPALLILAGGVFAYRFFRRPSERL
jgi:hypothetical protein